MRPATVDLWRQLSISDKKQFLRCLLSHWNKHRHRMAPASKEIIDRLFVQERLKIVKGRVIAIREETPLKVSYENNGQTYSISADYVYNCTGPDFTLLHSKEPLIQNLLKRGLIAPDPLGLGIHCNAHLQAEGPLSKQVYAIGSLLLGERFETTAVPEIRVQASLVAASIGDKA